MVLKFPFQLRRILYKYCYIYNTIYVNKENKKKNESKMQTHGVFLKEVEPKDCQPKDQNLFLDLQSVQ